MRGPGGPVLVIGSTDGIGLALVRALVARGDEVIGIGRREAASEGPRHEHVVVDVTVPEYPARLCEIFERRRPTTAIHCAGIGSGFDPADLSGEVACIRTNLLSAVETAAALVPAWRAAGIPGHLVALSSLADLVVLPESPSYAASKVGLSRYLRGLGIALQPEGIAVTNIRFGFVDTKMAKGSWRPFMVSRERAAEVVLRALAHRRAVVSFPWRALWLVTVVRWAQALGLALRPIQRTTR